MRDVTVSEVLAKTGISEPSTLYRWRQSGLIPHPEIRDHASGRGKAGYWPEWVMHHCVRIQQLRREGKTLAEIRDFLGNDWDAISSQYLKTYRFSEVSRDMDQRAAMENLRECISDLLFEFQSLDEISIEWLTEHILVETITSATTMMQQGINPVLIVTQDSVALTADFAVSITLSKRRTVSESLLVVPIWRELSAYLGAYDVFPDQPTVSAVERVKMELDGDDVETPVTVMSTWEFEISVVRKEKQSRRTRRENRQRRK